MTNMAKQISQVDERFTSNGISEIIRVNHNIDD